MKASACQTPNYLPLFNRRLEPKRKGLLWRNNVAVFLLLPPQIMRCKDGGTENIGYAKPRLDNMRPGLARK